MNADDVDPYRFQRVRHNRGVPIPVSLRIWHDGSLADAGKRLSQDVQRVLQIPTAARRVTIRQQNQPHAAQSPGRSDQLSRVQQTVCGQAQPDSWRCGGLFRMLRGDKIGLRARHEADVAVLQTELYDDVATRSRADSRPWRPFTPGSAASPYAIADPTDDAACFSVVDLADDQLVGEALLWGIDHHNRAAHIGISLRPSFRGRGLATDVIHVLCDYGFQILGLHRQQIETVADNAPMIRAAALAGFVEEGRLRHSAWVDGNFADQVILGLLATDWNGPQRRSSSASDAPTQS